MWQWLNKLLTVKTKRTDYQFMITTLASVIEEDKLDFIISTYLSNNNSIKNARAVLQ